MAQKVKEPTKIHGWVAKDQDGSMRFFFIEPTRTGGRWDGGMHINLPKGFKDIKVKNWRKAVEAEIEMTINEVK